jgi:hypothetical protein
MELLHLLPKEVEGADAEALRRFLADWSRRRRSAKHLT